MTGAYLRVKRGGKIQNIEIEHLTDKERKELINPVDLMRWFNYVCNTLVLAEKKLKDGGLKWKQLYL